MTEFGQLGNVVAREQDQLLGARASLEIASLESMRARYIASLGQAAQATRKSSGVPRPLLWVSGFAAAAAAVMLFWSLRPAGLTASFASGDRAADEGDVVQARSGAVVLDFSDGSKVSVAEGGTARVSELGTRGARISLLSGSLHVHVVHEPETNWVVEAGPYEVTVTGTRFDVAWDEHLEQFKLQMQEGSVLVSGGRLGSERQVRAGESILVGGEVAGVDGPSASDQPSAVDQTTVDPAAADQPGAPLDTAPATDRATGALPEPSASPAPRPGSEPEHKATWRERAAAGDFAAAYTLARSAGFEGLTASAPAAELLSLADVARFSGHLPESRAVLSALRRRFPGTHEAATAAFQLGRLGGNSRGAVDWFGVYLEEQPSGALAREATGRRMEVLSHIGQKEQARAQAKLYLKRYPSGPHAEFARTLVSR